VLAQAQARPPGLQSRGSGVLFTNSLVVVPSRERALEAAVGAAVLPESIPVVLDAVVGAAVLPGAIPVVEEPSVAPILKA